MVVDADGLRATVEAHAQARIDGDLPRFASYMTPQALVMLHRQADGVPQSPRRFSIIDITAHEDRGVSAVRFDGGGSYVMHAQWERRAAGWTVVRADIARDSIRLSWWKRMTGSRTSALQLERKDLQ